MFGDGSGPLDTAGEGGLFYFHGNSSRLSTRDKNRDTDRDTLRPPNEARSMRTTRSNRAALYKLGGGASSRFSLTDQFNTTRKEYQFDDADDASVYFAPASEAGFDEEDENDSNEPNLESLENTVILAPTVLDGSSREPEPPQAPEKHIPVSDPKQSGFIRRKQQKSKSAPLRDGYELFCVPKCHEATGDRASSWTDDMRAAFRRLMPLVHPDAQSDREMRDIASVYFNDVIKSYEVLMDPTRRVEYNGDLAEASLQGDYDTLIEKVDASNWTTRTDNIAVDSKCQHAAIRQIACARGIYTASDLTVRLDGRRRRRFKDPILLKPLDLAMGHAVSMPIPLQSIQNLLVQAAAAIPDSAVLIRREVQKVFLNHLHHLENPDPIVTVSAFVHALLENSPLARFAPFHFAMLSSLSPENMMRLAASGIEPGLVVGLEQEIPNPLKGLPPTLISVELSPLTMPTKSIHGSRAFKIRHMPHPVYVSASVMGITDQAPPFVELQAHQPLARARGGGAIWFSANSGDWAPSSVQNRTYTLFHRLQHCSRARLSLEGGVEEAVSLALAMPPRAEIGWTGCEIGSSGARPMIPCRRIGSTGLSGCNSHKGSYQLVTSIGGLSGLGISARYQSGLTHPKLQQFKQSRKVVLELELTTSRLMGPQVVGRAMARLGKFAHIGVEIGSGARGSLHVGLHWQRLGQRLSLPILVAAGEGCSLVARIAFWGVVTPLVVTAALNAFRKWKLSRMEGPEGKEARKLARESERMEAETKRIQAEELVEREQEQRRIEADTLSALLAPGTEARQLRERKEKGLVILSGKYGLRDDRTGEWDADEEIADVTIALAALVGEKSDITIPKGVKYERLLGWWDPCPGRRKTLVVRYVLAGKEGEAVTKSGEKFVLGGLDV